MNSQDTEAKSPETKRAIQGATTEEKPIRFNYQYAPWNDVLEQFAEDAGLSLVMNSIPLGTFNYSKDKKAYTSGQAIDILNGVLSTRGYTLVRREKMLIVVNLEDGLPPDLLATISVEELADIGKFELARCLFDVKNIAPEEAETEIRKVLSRLGVLEVLPKSRKLLITDTGGRLRVVAGILRAFAESDELKDTQMKAFNLLHLTEEEVMPILRQMLGLDEDENSSDDGLRMSSDVIGNRILVSGTEDHLKRIDDVLKIIDVPLTLTGDPKFTYEEPQLVVYKVTDADSTATLDVLLTLFEDDEEIRLATEPKSGNIVALATPTQHRTIRATLDELQKDGKEVEVIPLYTVDPQTAVLAVTNLFGSNDGENTNAPKVEADITNSNLLIYGSKGQIAQIQLLMQKMGEDEEAYAASSRGGNVRFISISPRKAQQILDQVDLVWPTMRTNKIRTVTPSRINRELDGSIPNAVQERKLPNQKQSPNDTEPNGENTDKKSQESTTPAGNSSKKEKAPSGLLKQGSASLQSVPHRLVAQVSDETIREAINKALLGKSSTEDSEPTRQESETKTTLKSIPNSEIVIAPGPGGWLVASKDLEALDAFERLVQMLSNESEMSDDQYSVYYLLHEKADVAAEMLNEILGNTSSSSGGSSGGGGLLGGLADAALSGASGGDGGILGVLGIGGGSGGITTSGSVSIVPNTRLNLLVIEANPIDLDLIDQLLAVIDQNRSPQEVKTIAAPKAIPLRNTDANEIAEIVRGAYSGRILGVAGGQDQQPKPEDLIRALRGGGRRGGSRRSEQEPQKISVAVDSRNNRLIIGAPDPVFEEIQAFVKHLDTVDVQSSEITEVVTLQKADPEMIQKALSAIVGAENVSSSTGVASPIPPGGPNRPRPSNQRNGGSSNIDRARQQFEMLRALQNAGKDRGENGKRE